MYFDGSSEEMRAITTEVNDTIEATQNSPAIPQDMRLPEKKRFMVGSYHLADDITIPILPVEDDMDDQDTDTLTYRGGFFLTTIGGEVLITIHNSPGPYSPMGRGIPPLPPVSPLTILSECHIGGIIP
jgi:hypothetical protein